MTEQLHFHFSLSCTGEGNGNPLQYSCLESPRDGGAWWAALYGVAQSRIQLKWLSSSSSRILFFCCCSVAKMCPALPLKHTGPHCPSPSPGVYPSSCPLNCWCHPTISSFVALFFCCLHSFPASVSFPMSQLFASGGQSIGASASVSVLPVNTQGWFPGLIDWFDLLAVWGTLKKFFQ